MTMTNHMVTGAVIALVVKQPALALPLAFLSHFVLDALPHYGERGEEQMFSRLTRAVIVTDLVVAGSFWLWLLVSGQYLPAAAAFAAASPDAVWGLRLAQRQLGVGRPMGAFSRFHSWIQWSERHWGLVVELVYGRVAFAVLRGLLS